MHILLFNMPVNDIVGSSALFPQILTSMLSQNKLITYSACYVQAFLIHLYGTGSFLILTAMAYDRYIAICCPLKYNSIMSPKTLLRIIITVWSIDFSLVGLLLGLSYRDKICSTKIVDFFCNNPGLMRLVCGDIRFNNYYGLSYTAVQHFITLFIMFFTYIQILITCISKKQSDAKSKAIQTCGTHLVVYLFLEFCTLFAVISHRFDNVSQQMRMIVGSFMMIFPPFFNPLIYVFILGALTYCAILFFNMTLLLTIALNQKLHKPMHILLFNMPVNDIIGASAFFPQVISSILSQNRSITYISCYVQTFLTHLYGAGALLILTAMAYDRYIAICHPLKYNTWMSPNNLLKIIIAIWTLDFTLIGVLLALSYRQEICNTKIVDTFCNNPSLMKLICGDISLNNYYGLLITIFLQGLSLLIVIFTYIQILITCIFKRQFDVKSKALQTCGTHLVVFLCVEFNAFLL
ncbi:hypothetical protein HF521_003255 [Silurus meridionalis]|uniref:G-protein coupled receptors family 1 profile domain-containing protein n=1 Tax=Silurus meridionalis TaxID=175797 RepID=A0A8T0B2C2_SILME|nr:hypothetical protein HF521_003255 [Silurus meridionalis]